MKAELEKLLLSGLNVIHELGRQRCFELGNPYYSQFAEDQEEPDCATRNYQRKEMPTGEVYLVDSEIIFENGYAVAIEDTIIRQIK